MLHEINLRCRIKVSAESIFPLDVFIWRFSVILVWSHFNRIVSFAFLKVAEGKKGESYSRQFNTSWLHDISTRIELCACALVPPVSLTSVGDIFIHIFSQLSGKKFKESIFSWNWGILQRKLGIRDYTFTIYFCLF